MGRDGLPKRAHAGTGGEGGAVDIEAFKRLKIGHRAAQRPPQEEENKGQLVLYRGAPAHDEDSAGEEGSALGLVGGASLARASLTQILSAPTPLLRSDPRGRELVPYAGGSVAPHDDLCGRDGPDNDDDDDDDLHRMECD